MLPSNHWANSLTIDDGDVEYLTGLLLDKETPLPTRDLLLAVLEHRMAQQTEELEKRFEGTQVYNPAASYEVGEKLVFPHFDFSVAEVTAIRAGENEEYGEFKVARVVFENNSDEEREFAIDLGVPHALSSEDGDTSLAALGDEQFEPEQILAYSGDELVDHLETMLRDQESLTSVAGMWFPRDLLMQPNEGHLNLVEAVLDIVGGGPLPSEQILDQIGGLGDGSTTLQEFSLNYALNEDRRFDEVGPTGEILWYLSRMAPDEVVETPQPLRYTPIDYERGLLLPEMRSLEAELADELSPLETSVISGTSGEATITLIYPHRRVGTLPLNHHMRYIFPTARRTSHVWITLVDAQDGEEYTGWVVPGERYVYGLKDFYEKHQIPIGGFITVSKTAEPDKISIDYGAYRPRTEWIRLIQPKGETIGFENSRRSIGANFDDLMILGADDLEGLDDMIAAAQKQRPTLAATLRMVIPPLGRLTPQGTAHAKTIYSAVNVLRRCPPGPIMATLEANPDFENVGGHYWRLSD